MSSQITTAFVHQFRGDIEHLAQQDSARLPATVRQEMLTGEKGFFDQLGITAATKKTTRHGQTPVMNTPHARRMVVAEEYEWADLIDEDDAAQVLVDTQAAYAEAAAMAIARAYDAEIIRAADAAAFTGKDGATTTAFDSANIVDVAVRSSGSGDTGLNVEKLRAAKEILDANEVDADSRTLVANARQLRNLLAETEVTSSDYNTVKALVQGDLNTFLGFTVVRSELIGTDRNGDQKVLFYQRRGILLAQRKNYSVRVSERDDLSYALQVYACATFGATRMLETHVGYIECDPS